MSSFTDRANRILIDRVEMRSVMLKHRSGVLRDQPWLYTPKSGELIVPDETGCHARPILLMYGKNGKVAYSAAIWPEHLELRSRAGPPRYIRHERLLGSERK